MLQLPIDWNDLYPSLFQLIKFALSHGTNYEFEIAAIAWVSVDSIAVAAASAEASRGNNIYMVDDFPEVNGNKYPVYFGKPLLEELKKML